MRLNPKLVKVPRALPWVARELGVDLWC